MIESIVDIPVDAGDMNSYVTYPDEGGPFPLILFLMDAPGLRPELEKMANRLASAGYCVVVPNLYYRKSKSAGVSSRAQMVEYMDSLDTESVLADCAHAIAWARQHEFVATSQAGVVGYCMSGPFAFAAAGQMPNEIATGASIHGVRLMTEAADSPHLTAGNLSGEFYIGCAQTDHWAPVEMINRLESYCAINAPNVRVEWYPETEHGFVFPERSGKYHHIAAERHWHRLLTLFARHLKDAA